MRDLLLLFITSLCSLGALRSPFFGLMCYVGYAVVSPQSYMWNIGSDFPHSKYIAVCTILGYLFSSETKQFPRQRESYILIGLWVVFAISTMVAMYPAPASRSLTLVSKIFLIALLSTSIINTEDRLHTMLKVIALGLGFYGLRAGIFVILTGATAPIWGPKDTYFEANNTIGMALAINVPMLYYLSKVEPRYWLRWAIRVMLIFSYPAVAGTFARASWIGLALMTALIVIKSRRKVLTLIAVGVFAITAASLVPRLVSSQLTQRFETLENPEDDGSAQTRFWSWEFCMRVGTARPWFGGGFNLYSLDAYAQYYPEFLDRWPGKVWQCHNMWLSIFAEHGYPGILLWSGLILSCLFSLRQIRSYGRATEGSSWLVDYANMFQISLLGFIIIGIFVDFAYYEVFYQLVAAIICMKEIVKSKANDQLSTTSASLPKRPAFKPKAAPA